MSRAFVKEADDNLPSDELPERPQSPHANYVTPRGLEAASNLGPYIRGGAKVRAYPTATDQGPALRCRCNHPRRRRQNRRA